MIDAMLPDISHEFLTRMMFAQAIEWIAIIEKDGAFAYDSAVSSPKRNTRFNELRMRVCES